ncbi:MAG: ribonuclease PH [Myxococcales bacterium]|nr:ribonuclease PH [Myxococcales bacterium]
MRTERRADQMRPVSIEPGFLTRPLGCVLIAFGETRVLCCASIENRVPPWMVGRGKGWITGEYSLLPGSTSPRARREASSGKISGRTQEIQRLIGRSLRMAVDLEKLGERTLWVDCDVLQADGGTRTAAITGGWVALALAIDALLRAGELRESPIARQVAAVSVGIVDGETLLDLEYREDSRADVDLNVVMTGTGELIEVQGTAESHPFTPASLAQMTALAHAGISELLEIQRRALEGCGAARPV